MQLVQSHRYSFTLRAALQYLNISLNSKCLRYLAEEGNIIIDAQMFGVFFKPNSFASASFTPYFPNK